MCITEERLDYVREQMKKRLGEKRFTHTLGVEREAKRLCDIYLPEKTNKMRLAALLHDITKELKVSEHLAICDKFNVMVTDEYIRNPKLLHALTGAYFAKSEFGDIIDEEIFNSILYHTVGKEDMTLSEKIIYLADYIEETRTFADCIKLRDFFYNGLRNVHSEQEKAELLDRTLILSFDMTLACLVSENSEISVETVKARNYLIRNL